jgi:hypothetical protein
METKKCTQCLVVKPLSLFYKNQFSCKDCKKKFYNKNKHKIKEYRERNKEKIKILSKENYSKNKERYRKQNKQWIADHYEQQLKYWKEYDLKHYEKKKKYIKERYWKNRDFYLKKTKEYNSKNKDKKNAYQRKYRQSKKEKDPNFRLATNLRLRFKRALIENKGKKCLSILKLLGCSVEEARLYLESQFLPGMSWDNHGEWHIDHIKPCASFDLTDLEQQKISFHYTNLQPLWAKDNYTKGSFYP